MARRAKRYGLVKHSAEKVRRRLEKSGQFKSNREMKIAVRVGRSVNVPGAFFAKACVGKVPTDKDFFSYKKNPEERCSIAAKGATPTAAVANALYNLAHKLK